MAAPPILRTIMISCLNIVTFFNRQDSTSSERCFTGKTYNQDKISDGKPNIVFIVSDDQGYGDVGFRGSDILTPNIDRLAAEGVILEHHYVQPTCSATRASLLTGRYGIRTQFWQGNIKPWSQWGLPLNETTLAEMFQRNGYATYAVGKWHLGMYTYDYTPIARGFDYFYGFYLGSQTYYNHINTRTYDFRENYLDLHGKIVDDIKYEDKGKHNTYLFTKKSVELIANHGEGCSHDKNPFFLLLSYAAPHTPYQSSRKRQKMFASHMKNASADRKTYASMVSYMDDGIGEIVRTLDQYNLRRNTIVVLISDNGAELLGPGSNYPLRGGKRGYFEGGVRSIAVVNSPMLAVTGYTNTHLHHVTDWYTTFQHLVGDNTENLEKRQFPLDGFNMWDSINRNVSSGRNEVLLSLREEEYVANQVKERKNASETNENTLDLMLNDHFIIRWREWKLLHGDVLLMGYTPKYPVSPGAGNRTVGVPRISLQDTRLYNLQEDPREAFDVKDEHRDVVNLLLSKRRKYKENLSWIPPRAISLRGIKNAYGVWYPWR